MTTTSLRNYWNRIISTGIEESLPESEKKFVRFTNIVAALTVIAVGAYIPQSLFTGAYLLAGLQLIDTLCVLLVFALNARGQYCYAKFTYMAVINVFVVINGCFIGKASGVHEFLFITNIVPFLLYRVTDYTEIASGILLSLAAFVAFYFLYPHFTQYNLPLAEQESIYAINIVMKFILFGMALYILASYTYKTEMALEKSNHKLTEQAAELQRSNEDLEQFAYIISHDLKTPVANINSLLTLYMTRFMKEEDKGRDFLQHSQQSAARLASLIDDLLSYCKVGRNLPEVAPTDLNQLLSTLRMEMGERLRAKNASIRIAANMPVLNNVHSNMIYHVFQNLISNGIKFNTKQNPEVVVAFTEENNKYIFSVRDNGIGIPQQYYDKLFDMFKRLHTTEYEGTGMGLAICKKIVQHYNGQIWLESIQGEGTTFYFTLGKGEPREKPNETHIGEAHEVSLRSAA